MRCSTEAELMEKHSAEEWLRRAQTLIPVVLQKAKSVESFPGRWKTIISKMDLIPTRLSDLSSHPCFSKNRLCHEQLQSVVKTLHRVVELAESCSTDKYEGKLQMQSDLDALVGKLDLNLRDCSVLMKTGVLGEATLPLSISCSSETPKQTGLKELLARLQIGHMESKQRALESLLQMMREDEKTVMPLIGRGNVASLVQLLTATSTGIREKAVDFICVLAESGEYDEWLVSEGALPPLVRLAHSPNPFAREKAVISLHRLSITPETARDIAGEGGIRPLIDLCRTGDSVSQAAAAVTLKNLSAVPDLAQFLADEGMVKASIDLLSHGMLLATREHMADCLQNLTATNESIRQAVVSEGGVVSLLAHLARPLPQEPAVAALKNLIPSVSSEKWAALNLLPRLEHVLKSGSPGAQQAAASALCRFASTEETKRLVGESGCISLLVKLLESKSNGCREVAAQGIAGLVMEGRSRREVRKDEKSVPNLVMLLDPNPANTAKKYAIAGLLGLSGSDKSKKVMISYGAIGYLKKLSEMEVSGAKKLLEKLERGSSNRLRSLFHR